MSEKMQKNDKVSLYRFHCSSQRNNSVFFLVDEQQSEKYKGPWYNLYYYKNIVPFSPVIYSNSRY